MYSHPPEAERKNRLSQQLVNIQDVSSVNTQDVLNTQDVQVRAVHQEHLQLDQRLRLDVVEGRRDVLPPAESHKAVLEAEAQWTRPPGEWTRPRRSRRQRGVGRRSGGGRRGGAGLVSGTPPRSQSTFSYGGFLTQWRRCQIDSGQTTTFAGSRHFRKSQGEKEEIEECFSVCNNSVFSAGCDESRDAVGEGEAIGSDSKGHKGRKCSLSCCGDSLAHEQVCLTNS